MPVYLERLETGMFAVRGEMDFSSVESLWRQADEQFQGPAALQIDLGGVSRADSAGVALLVEWLCQAKERGQQLRFVNIPAQMTAIINVADLDELLPLS